MGSQVPCPAGTTTIVDIELNPQIRVETGWGLPAQNATTGRHPRPARPATHAAAVVRGSLLFTLPLTQIATVVRTWAPFNNTDLALRTATPWNFALNLSSTLSFHKNPDPFNESLPFGLSKYFGVIRATGVPLPSWNVTKQAAEEPPPSPINCSAIATQCGESTPLTLVPYGATNLRVSGFPWL
jgi:hypothetical protein